MQQGQRHVRSCACLSLPAVSSGWADKPVIIKFTRFGFEGQIRANSLQMADAEGDQTAFFVGTFCVILRLYRSPACEVAVFLAADQSAEIDQHASCL